MPLDYDAVVTVSGDGLVHEVLNGFAQHTSSAEAFAIPLAPIPTGSGNGLCLNLLGLEVRSLFTAQIVAKHDAQAGFDVAAAALNVIKGLIFL